MTLPALTDWRMAQGSPEAQPGFDDADWQKIDNRAYASITARADGQPNMLMDAYGFHEGDVWYRGRFAGTSDAERVRIHYGAGGSGLVQVFLDGKLIGQEETPSALPRPITTGVATFALPETARAPGEHVLSVMVRNNGHNWDLDADDFHKEARGSSPHRSSRGRDRAFRCRSPGASRAARAARIWPTRCAAWRTTAACMASGRAGTCPASTIGAGRRFAYRRRRRRRAPAGTAPGFDLDVPKGQDATIGVAVGDTSKPRSASAAYRVLIFVNGWHMGQFIAHVGPQRVFPVPEGILNHRGRNTIALAVTSDGAPGNALEEVKLVTMRNVRGGLPVRTVAAPTRPEALR